MENFSFQNPTRLVFGQGSIAKLSQLVPAKAKVLITFGGGSVKKNGVYDQVVAALKGFDCLEFWGIEPNPTYETLSKAVEIVKREKVNFLLAVGGGSTVDGTKYIAAASTYDGDGWDLILDPSKVSSTIPLASVLTLPATGSEMNNGAVISRLSTQEKYAFFAATNYPVFSILDPQSTYSLPKYQVACGIADTYVHVLEQYLTRPGISPLMDRWAEGILQTLVEIAPKALADEKDYDSMANLMLCATMGLNGFIGMGVPQDWATHQIGHELTALTGLTHGATLVIVMPSLMSVMAEEKGDKILQYGERVWGITEGDRQFRIFQSIVKTDQFFQSLGLVTTLNDAKIGSDVVNEIYKRFTERGTVLGENQTVTPEVVRTILEQTL